ncbi:MAG: HNH endonuclease signature motif containing protein [Gemmatimonadota bacterium]|nr:HNH endonuclease signature motif containing protein [Gemmatimonadota bacterium]
MSQLTPTGRRWARTRRAAFDRDGWRCVECGRAGRLEAHHVTPLHKGGAPYDLDNLATLCRSCHIDRHRRKLTPEEAAWRALVDDLLHLK